MQMAHTKQTETAYGQRKTCHPLSVSASSVSYFIQGGEKS